MLGLGPPRSCLKFGPRHALWMDFSRRTWGRSRRQYRRVDLPEGLLRPSPAEPNISDPPALEIQIRELIGLGPDARRSLRSTVLLLPDLCARVWVLALDAMPARRSELEQLVRWRLEREAFFPLDGTRLVTQTLGPRAVLAVVIREAVLRQYEAVCEAAGLAAVEVDLTTFRLCNLFSPLFSKEPVAVVSLLDGGFTFVIFNGGWPTFIRTKTRPQADDRLVEDLAHSLAFAEGTSDSAPRRLILFTEEEYSEVPQPLGDALGIEVISAGWEQLPRMRWACPNDTGYGAGSSLAVAAGVFGRAS